MHLSELQSKHLRRLGHDLKPVVMIGGAGVSEAVAAELDAALEHHELMKIRLRLGDRDARDRALEAIVERLGAALVQRVGNVALLYRPAEPPKLVLPRRES